MRRNKARGVLLLLAGAVALGLLTIAWAIGPGSSEADQGTMHNCPEPGKWSIAVWDGPSATETSEALATCDAEEVAAAYYLDPQTQGWSRWFAERPEPEVSNLRTLDDMQGVIAQGVMLTPTPTPTPTPPPIPTPTPTPTPTPAQETGYLPPPQEVGHISASGNAVVTISNDTPYTLTLEFEGTTSQSVTVARCDSCHEYSFIGPIFCPSDRPEETITLPSGTYDVTARVDDPSVTPFAGDWTLEGDTEYFHCFYIVTTFG
jgi:hypothetical protein